MPWYVRYNRSLLIHIDHGNNFVDNTQMDASSLLQRRRMRSQLLLKTRSSISAMRRQPSVQQYRSVSSTGRPTSSILNDTFRNKFQRILKEKKIKHLLDTQHSQKVSIFTNSTANQIDKEVNRCKRSLNDLILQRKAVQRDAAKLKNEISRFQQERKVLDNNQSVSDNDVKFLIRREHRLQNSEEDSLHTMRCYEFLQQRHRKDIVTWKARYEELERYHQQYGKSIKELEIEELNLLQTHRDLYSILQQTRNLVEVESQEKGSTLQRHRGQIQERRDFDRWMVERDKKKQQFKQQAGVLQERQQIDEYRAFYLANKFMLRLLKNKSQLLINKFKKQHQGFSYIRLNTGLNSANAILQRMQIQDQVYEDQLKHIYNLESRLKATEAKQDDSTIDSFSIPSGYQVRSSAEKLQRLSRTKNERQEQLGQLDRSDALLKDWALKNMKILGVSEEDLQGESLLGSLLLKLTRMANQT